MPVLGLLLLAGVLVTGAIALTRKSDTPSLPPGPVGRFLGQLRQGQLYRVWARVTGALTQADLRSRIERMGFGDIKLVTTDPTDPSVVSVIARWMLSSSETFDSHEVRLFQLEAVDEPPGQVKTSGDERAYPMLDGGLTEPEAEAIRWALMSDDDTKHLGGFASTLEPDFPIAASLLRAKAALANARSMGSVLAAELRAKNLKLVERFTRAAIAVGVGSGAPEWAKRMSSNTIDTLKRLTEGLVPPETWEKYRGATNTLGTFLPAHRMWMSDKAFSTLKKIAEAPRDIGEEGQEFAKRVSANCPSLAMVPGLGSGIACMRAAGAALSLATSLEYIDMREVAACLEGKSESTAFLTGAEMVGGFARGVMAPQEGLFGSLTRERESLTDKEKVAFDAGIALGFARALQATDFPALWSYVQGDTIGARSVAFAVAVGQAKREKKRPVSVLLGKIAAQIPPGSLTAIRRLAVDLVANENLLRHYPGELAAAKKVPVPVASAALAIVREVGEGIRVIDVNALRLLVPDEPKFQLGLTPAVLKLAMSMSKPYVSQVVDPGSIVAKVQDIRKSDTPDGEKARLQLERATKALERQRWADWCRKQVERQGAFHKKAGTFDQSLADGQLTRRA